MIFVGLDTSLNGTGLSILYSNGIHKTYTIKPGKLRGPARLNFIFSFLDSKIPAGVKIACIESASYGSVGKLFELGEVHGIGLLCLDKKGIKCYSVSPSALKKFATGNSLAEKEEVKTAAESRWNQTFEDDNQSDAFCLAQIAQCIGTQQIPTERHSAEVVTNIINPKKVSKKKIKKIIKNSI